MVLLFCLNQQDCFPRLSTTIAVGARPSRPKSRDSSSASWGRTTRERRSRSLRCTVSKDVEDNSRAPDYLRTRSASFLHPKHVTFWICKPKECILKLQRINEFCQIVNALFVNRPNFLSTSHSTPVFLHTLFVQTAVCITMEKKQQKHCPPEIWFPSMLALFFLHAKLSNVKFD